MSESYAAWWPVQDDDRTMSELTAEALPELEDMVAALARTIDGPVQWSTADRVDVGLVLLAVAPVRCVPTAVPDDHDDETPTQPKHGGRGRPPADVAEDVDWLLDAEPRSQAQNIADRLGMSVSGVYTALKRADRNDLRDRLVANSAWATGSPQRFERVSARRSA